MASTPTMLKGIVHGNLIELDQKPGLPDGQRVTVADLGGGGDANTPNHRVRHRSAST